MKLNSFRFFPSGYPRPDLPTGRCGPSDLTDLLIHFRDWERKSDAFGPPPISEQGIRILVDLAFYMSLAPEEGRFPRLKMQCSEETGSSFLVTQFDPVEIGSVESLRRLAPACTHPDCALLLAERDGMLWCDGVINIGSMGWDTVPGLPGISGVGHPVAFRLEVREPGHIVADNGIAYELRAGRIRHTTPWFTVPALQSFLSRFGRRLDQDYALREGQDRPQILGGNTGSRLIQELVSRMVRTAIEGRHGGTFVILPTEASDIAAVERFGIEMKYPAKNLDSGERTLEITANNLDMGHNILTHYLACAELQRTFPQAEYPQSSLRKCNITYTKMLMDAEAAGNLSAVDGCVVFNERLQLCGFGAKITVAESSTKGNSRVFGFDIINWPTSIP